MSKVLVTGGSGQLGQCISDIVPGVDSDTYTIVTREELDITNYDELSKYIESHNFDYIVNCAAYTNVDGAEDDYKSAYDCNCKGVLNLATLCKKNNIRLIHISTDYVFDGISCTPYKPNDKIKPIGNYGGSKSLGETAIRKSKCEYMIIRTSWLYSEYGKNFCKTMIDLFNKKDEIKVVYDQVGSPTYAMDLANFIGYIIMNDKFVNGTYHFSNNGVTSWYDFARSIYHIYTTHMHKNGCDDIKYVKIKCCLSNEFQQKAKRPNYSVLDCSDTEKIFDYGIPYWRDSLSLCIYNIVHKE